MDSRWLVRDTERNRREFGPVVGLVYVSKPALDDIDVERIEVPGTTDRVPCPRCGNGRRAWAAGRVETCRECGYEGR